jgi:hypothetical protein
VRPAELFEWGSSHPPARAVEPALPAEFIVFVLLFDFRRCYRQREGVVIVGRRLDGFCMSALLSRTSRLLRLM